MNNSKGRKFLTNPFVLTVIAIILGFLVAMVILAIAGFPPFESVAILVKGMVGRPKDVAAVIVKSTPIIFTGLGVAFAFKTGLFNIGAEGQYMVGCVAAVAVGSVLDLPAPIQIVVTCLAAVIVSALYAGLVGLLKAKIGIHEVITSIMMNWIALYINNFFCNTKFYHRPNSLGSYPVRESSYTMILYNWKRSEAGREVLRNNEFLRQFLGRNDINAGFIVAVIAAIFITWLLTRTKKGFELRAVGSNIYAAQYTGIDVNKNIIHSMMISGALCGLGAAFYITGQSPHLLNTLAAFENVGFNGLSVAFIAQSSPIGCIFAGLLFGGLLYGGSTLQSQLGAPTEIINIVIGVIVFLVALSVIIPNLLNKHGKKEKKPLTAEDTVRAAGKERSGK